jgi:hypothetical protein
MKGLSVLTSRERGGEKDIGMQSEGPRIFFL